MCLEIKNNFDINKLINTFIKNNIGNFKLQDNNLIKFRYEYILNNNDKNIFIYLNNWTQLLNLYNLIPESKRHFYEIINNKCKFFLDLDAKCQDFEIEEWNKHILHIKKKIKNDNRPQIAAINLSFIFLFTPLLYLYFINIVR